MDGLLRQSALDQAELIRRREISCGELLELYLDRIARFDPELCSVVQRLDRPARRAARRLDQRGGGDAVFRGVPIGIKDCDPVFGTFTRVGSRAFKYAWTPFDSPAVRRLRRAGFVLAAKTSTSELTLLPFVEPAIHPPTRNPWDSRRTSGGSSGGSATAVAAGLLPIAHASDGGGSIRIPASFCHLFGHKHSRGLLPNFAGRLDPLRLAAVAAVSHSVEDVAAVLDVLSGRSDVVPRPGSLRAAVRRPPPVGLRVRLCVASSVVEVDPEVAAAVRAVGRLLQERGDHVEEGAPLGVDLQAYLPVYQRFAAGIPVLHESLLEPVSRWLREPGRRVGAADARRIQQTLAREVLEWFGDADLRIMPTVARPAPAIGAFRDLPPEASFQQAAELGAFTAVFNASGQPAATVPAALSSAGLPIGVQIAGPPGADALVLQVARHLEQALAWTDRRSPFLT